MNVISIMDCIRRSLLDPRIVGKLFRAAHSTAGTLLWVWALMASSSLCPTQAAESSASPAQLAAKIDGFLQSHWSARQIKPAAAADDESFLRRVTLDLVGRIPTVAELDRFLDQDEEGRRQQQIRRLLDSPEFPLYLGHVLDQMLQTRFAGDSDFVDYLRTAVRENKSWDTIFRELMLGPWEPGPTKAANRFLDKRAKTLDVLVADATRVFFGVDISCAKCHDHPLVDDWKQEHFYGMASFFNRTTGGKGRVGEKQDGEVTFLGNDGKEHTARMMFLSGRTVDEPTAAQPEAEKKHFSRRAQLVSVALEEKSFLSRSIVNRLWKKFLGRGLVEPVDQMHSGNPDAVPGLLNWLAEDFAAHGYDLRRLVTALVSTRAYQLSSRWQQDSPVPDPDLFAVMPIRPLTRQQFACSILLATGNSSLTAPDEIEQRVERYLGVSGIRRIEEYLKMEQQAAKFSAALDPSSRKFHSSTTEALFMSNNSAAQGLVSAAGDNLAASLANIQDNQELVGTAVRTVLSRSGTPDELTRLVEWLGQRGPDRVRSCEQLVWVLVTSAEFRFNH